MASKTERESLKSVQLDEFMVDISYGKDTLGTWTVSPE